jgi:hypothetical protein
LLILAAQYYKQELPTLTFSSLEDKEQDKIFSSEVLKLIFFFSLTYSEYSPMLRIRLGNVSIEIRTQRFRSQRKTKMEKYRIGAIFLTTSTAIGF